MTPASRVADALGLFWADRHPGATVYVGFDTRAGAAEHAALAAAVMAAYGLDLRLSDRPVPTPAVALATARDPACAGALVLTASESPAEWGGMVVRGADGGPLGAAALAEVERLVSGEPPAARGAVTSANLAGPYVDALVAQVDAPAIAAATPLVVVDALFGATRTVAPRALARAGCEVVALHIAADPTLGSGAPSPREPWTRPCAREVVHVGAACGLVLDGDGDRSALVDERGRLIAAADLVTLLVTHMVCGRGQRGRVVVTAASSARVRRQAERLGCELTAVPVGFERVHGELLEGDVMLAAEEYGGVCVPAWLRERDGLLAGLLVIEMLVRSGRSLGDLVDELEDTVGHMDYAQRDLTLDAAQIQTLRNMLPGVNPALLAGRAPVAVSHADGLRLQFGDDSWVMLRPARTQPVVRAYAEAPTAGACQDLLDAVCDMAEHIA